MVRSLWTGASGMIAQQLSLDNIANNLANISTTGYKKENMEFRSLLYQTIQKDSTDSDGNPKPTGVQVGLGVRNAAITSQFTQGAFLETGGQWDFAIDGDGFFAVQQDDGTIGYTRNGSFQMTMGASGGLTLCTSSGEPVLDINGSPIVLDPSYTAGKLSVDANGFFCYPDASGNPQPIGYQVGLVQFNNPAGLLKTSGSIFKETAASGPARWESQDANLQRSGLVNKYVEGSTVQAVDEMVNLIVTQRAYEMNSKVITASDTMLQQANNLRG